jgi:hypothetical protein
MGKMDKKEIMVISIITLIFSPFFVIGKAIRTVGESLGIIKKKDTQPEPPKE